MKKAVLLSNREYITLNTLCKIPFIWYDFVHSDKLHVSEWT